MRGWLDVYLCLGVIPRLWGLARGHKWVARLREPLVAICFIQTIQSLQRVQLVLLVLRPMYLRSAVGLKRRRASGENESGWLFHYMVVLLESVLKLGLLSLECELSHLKNKLINSFFINL